MAQMDALGGDVAKAARSEGISPGALAGARFYQRALWKKTRGRTAKAKRLAAISKPCPVQGHPRWLENLKAVIAEDAPCHVTWLFLEVVRIVAEELIPEYHALQHLKVRRGAFRGLTAGYPATWEAVCQVYGLKRSPGDESAKLNLTTRARLARWAELKESGRTGRVHPRMGYVRMGNPSILARKSPIYFAALCERARRRLLLEKGELASCRVYAEKDGRLLAMAPPHRGWARMSRTGLRPDVKGRTLRKPALEKRKGGRPKSAMREIVKRLYSQNAKMTRRKMAAEASRISGKHVSEDAVRKCLGRLLREGELTIDPA